MLANRDQGRPRIRNQHDRACFDHFGQCGKMRYLILIYLDRAGVRIRLLRKDRRVNLGRRLVVVNATLCEFFLLLFVVGMNFAALLEASGF